MSLTFSNFPLGPFSHLDGDHFITSPQLGAIVIPPPHISLEHHLIKCTFAIYHLHRKQDHVAPNAQSPSIMMRRPSLVKSPYIVSLLIYKIIVPPLIGDKDVTHSPIRCLYMASQISHIKSLSPRQNGDIRQKIPLSLYSFSNLSPSFSPSPLSSFRP